jgi:hypothetical protein
VNERYIENSGNISCARVLWLTALLVLAGAAIVTAQEVSTEILPSEDELLDALNNGEIDYDQYIILNDLLLNGVDSSQLYLFEFVPGLHVGRHRSRRSLEREQEAAFSTDTGSSAQWGGISRYRYGQELSDNGRAKYRSVSKFLLNDQFAAELTFAREYSGRERVTNRSLTWRGDSSGVVRRVRVGNFREKFGLGTALGYRGKLLDYSDRLEAESWFCPDWGGFNGVVVDAARRNLSATVLGSYQRDSMHSLMTAAVQGKASRAGMNTSVIVAANSVTNRATDQRVNVFHTAVNLTQKTKTNDLAMEIAFQSGEKRALGAAVEAGRETKSYDISVAGWGYSRDFLDFSSGSRAASLSRTEHLDDIEFDYSEKRAGQIGWLVKSDFDVNDKSNALGELLWANRGEDTLTLQGLAGFERQINASHSVRFDYLYKTTEKLGAADNTRRRGRCEWSIIKRQLRVRSSVSFTNETTHGEYWSWLVCFVRKASHGEQVQVWSNLRRFAHGRLDYWYGFVSFTCPVMNGISGGVKLADTYDRTSSPTHAVSCTLEVTARW